MSPEPCRCQHELSTLAVNSCVLNVSTTRGRGAVEVVSRIGPQGGPVLDTSGKNGPCGRFRAKVTVRGLPCRRVNPRSTSRRCRADLNRCDGFCRPAPNPSATAPRAHNIQPPTVARADPLRRRSARRGPARTRTWNPRFRRATLYPVELQARGQSGRRDSNPRPPAPKAGALPGCATPRSPPERLETQCTERRGPTPACRWRILGAVIASRA